MVKIFCRIDKTSVKNHVTQITKNFLRNKILEMILKPNLAQKIDAIETVVNVGKTILMKLYLQNLKKIHLLNQTNSLASVKESRINSAAAIIIAIKVVNRIFSFKNI